MTVKQDGDFVKSLIEEFFSQAPIIDKLNKFIECKDSHIRGWETWWQIEFALFLENQDEVAEWQRESQYALDKRKTSKGKMNIDLILRRKNNIKSHFIGLELKQAWSFSKCKRGMFKDIDKINLIKGSKDNLRSYWNIGVFLEDKEENDEGLKAIIEKEAQDKNYGLVKSCTQVFPIKETSFKVIFF